ncbi:MAG: mevalonate kinase [Candidatus Diapherotrites archaeon]
MSVKASAPGNIFFAGEHAVVYGYPAVVTAVDLRAYCTASILKSRSIIVESRELGKAKASLKSEKVLNRHGKKELYIFFDLIEILIKKHGIKRGIRLSIESDVPVESGLSSSTAVLSASLHALNLLFDFGIKKEDFFKYLYPLQVKVHGGKASGSEILSSSFGGYHKIQKIGSEGKISLSFENLGVHRFSVVIGNTNIRAPTALTVGMHMPSLIRRYPEFVQKQFKKIALICNSIEKALQTEDEPLLGSLMNKNQKILSKLGLSHPKLDDCIKEALNAGALGAKLSGGGWGGVMFALAKNGTEKKIAKAIESTGAQAIITKIGVEGVKECE